MSSDNGAWVMKGISPDDPSCIHSVEELERRIEEIGFLPLFAGEVPGFSVEEMTAPDVWWSGDPLTDPWEWRAVIAGGGKIAYGKFFNNRAGFVSMAWLPCFANYRRDGYDFDARFDDELAGWREKKIMDLYAGGNADRERFSFEIRAEAGFGKGGEKNFEGVLTKLQMETYLVCCAFRRRTNKSGKQYGWPIALYCTPEHLFGSGAVTSAYSEDPKDSLERLVSRAAECFPGSTEEQILNLLAFREDRPAKKSGLPWPRNLLKVLEKDRDPWLWTDDQISGLYVALGQMQSKYQKALVRKYRDGLTNDEIGKTMNRSGGTIGTYRARGIRRLRFPLNAAWYRDGYRANLKACAAGEHWTFDTGNPGDTVTGQDLCLRIGVKVELFENLMKAGITTVDDLRGAMEKDPRWYRPVRSVGPVMAKELRDKLEYFGFPVREIN